MDVVIALGLGDIETFTAAFPAEEFYCPPEDVLAIEVRRDQRGHANLISRTTGFKADVCFAFDELHGWGLAHRRTVDLDGLALSVAPVECVIVRKLEYYAEGKSEKHLRDIRGMLEMSSDAIDHALLARFVRERGLQSAWDAIG